MNKQNNDWRERWNKLTDTSDCPDDLNGANKWLGENETLYEESVYGEPMFDFDEDKILDFIKNLLKEQKKSLLIKQGNRYEK